MTPTDQTILDHIYRSLPVDPAELDFDDLSPIGRAALAMGAAPDLLFAWFKARRRSDDRVEAVVRLLVEDHDMTGAIDESIAAGRPGVVQDLVRAGVPWAHPGIPDLLSGEGRLAAAWLLTETQDEALGEWGDEIAFDALVDRLRPGAIIGTDQFVELLTDQRDSIDDGDGAARLDALLFGVDPELFVRRVMQGRSTWAWLGHAVSLADALHAYGPTTWLDTLAILEGTRAWDAFEFAASLSVAGTAIDREPIDEETAQALAEVLLDEEVAADAVTDPYFALPASLADDPGLQTLFVECAAHEHLSRSEFGSPGIAGLPLSGGALDDAAIEATVEFLSEIAEADGLADDLAVGAVRTLCDLAYWALADPTAITTEPIEDLVQALRDHGHTAVKVAAEQAHVAMSGQSPDAHGEVAQFIGLLAERHHTDLARVRQQEGCVAYATVERLGALGTEESARHLIDFWTDGALVRADHARAVLGEALSVLAEKSD